jgi:hypothetical protein
VNLSTINGRINLLHGICPKCMDRLLIASEFVRGKRKSLMYPACLIGTWAVALMGIRARL